MATAEGTDLASVPRWFLALAGSYLAGLVVLGIVISAASVFSLLAISEFYPEAIIFHWLGTLGVVFGMIGAGLTNAEEEAAQRFLNRYSDLTGREKRVYTITILAIFIGMFSFLIGFLAIALGVFVQQTGMGVIAILIALWYPAIDVRMGRTIGINLATVGALTGLGLMIAVSVAWKVSPSIPRRAAGDIRASFQ